MSDDPRAAYIASSVASLSSVGDTKALSAKVEALDDVDTFINDPSKRLLRVTIRRPGAGRNGDGDDESGLLATTSLKVDSGDAEEQDGTVVVKEISFVKVTSEILTEDNIASAVMVVSGAGKSSAAENLYHSLNKVFAPKLAWESQVDSKTVNLISNLDVNLRNSVGVSSGASGFGGDGGGMDDDEDESLLWSVMQVPNDEFRFWNEAAKRQRGRYRDAGETYSKIFAEIAPRFSKLAARELSISEVSELVEDTRDALDDAWQREDVSTGRYSERRMRNLMHLITVALSAYIRGFVETPGPVVDADADDAGEDEDDDDKGKGESSSSSSVSSSTSSDPTLIWKEDLRYLQGKLTSAIELCREWISKTTELTSGMWDSVSCPDHEWRGGPYDARQLQDIEVGLLRVLSARQSYSELMGAIDPTDLGGDFGGGEQKAGENTGTARAFRAFDGLSPFRYNSYTKPRWDAATEAFERQLQPAEDVLCDNLRSSMRKMADKPHLLLRFLLQYRNLLGKARVRQKLAQERGTLAMQLTLYMEHLDKTFTNYASQAADAARERRQQARRGGETLTTDVKALAQARAHLGPMLVKTMSHSVSLSMWGEQLHSKVLQARDMARVVCGDLKAFGGIKHKADTLVEDIRSWLDEQFVEWQSDTLEDIQEGRLSLAKAGSLIVIDQHNNTGDMEVTYKEQLVTLLREVRQFRQLGRKIAPEVAAVAEMGEQYYHLGVMLKKVANFYNTLGYGLLECHQKMLLDLLEAFEDKCQDKRSWQSPEDCKEYVSDLQRTANLVSRKYQDLKRYHRDMGTDTVRLMNVDMLRRYDTWKQIWGKIRARAEKVCFEKFKTENASWRLHWDHQLYKAMEASYQMGLESLNENIETIHVDVSFSRRRLRFKPAMEELRTKYYREIKVFIARPCAFDGLTGNAFSGADGRSSSPLSKSRKRSRRGANPLFSKMVVLNEPSVYRVFAKGEELFRKLRRLLRELQAYVALASVDDIDEYVQSHVTDVAGYEANFAAIRKRQKACEKLPDVHRIDCFSISLLGLKSFVDRLLQQVGDALVLSLRKRIVAGLDKVEAFVETSMEVLSRYPKDIAEYSGAMVKWQEIRDEAGSMKQLTTTCNDWFQRLAKYTGQQGLAGADVGAADMAARLSAMNAQWESLNISVMAYTDILDEAKRSLEQQVHDQIQEHRENIERFRETFNSLIPNEVNDWSAETLERRVYGPFEDLKAQFASFSDDAKAAVESCKYFKLETPTDLFVLLETLKEEMDAKEASWKMYKEYASELQELKEKSWITFRSRCGFELSDLCAKWQEKIKVKLQDEGTSLDAVTERILDEVSELKKALTGLKYCRGEPFKDEHWAQLYRKLKMPRDVTLATLTFGHFVESMETVKLIVANEKFFKSMTSRAQGEVQIREALLELKAWATTAEVTLLEHELNGRVTPLITEWKDLFTDLGDNQALLGSLKDSQYFKPFAAEALTYEAKMVLLDEVLHAINSIQRKWVYLEPIFARGALPQEQSRFQRVDDEFRDIMSRLHGDPLLFTLADSSYFPGIQDSVSSMLDQLERCQKALSDFLEEKRSRMPRFYFIGDDDLLEILGQATNPRVIQAHLKNCFQGIHRVGFSEDSKSVISLISVAGETVQLFTPVKITPEVEEWLTELSDEMKRTLKRLVQQCANEMLSGATSDPTIFDRYPSQVLCVANQIRFATGVEDAIRKNRLDHFEEDLASQLQSYTSFELSGQPLLQLKIKSLVLELIHLIDVVKLLRSAGVRDAGQWLWQKQLRFYLVSDDAGPSAKCVARMCNAEFNYTYEYQGNAGKLVHTPLTDKCYLTLTQGMHMGYGGNPYGPAGTGKTESVKALGGLLGRQVLVFNCDEGIDFQSMGRIFTGLVKCGAWGCFDEFNRLKEDQLSAVSQQIQVIQDAIKNKLPRITLMENSINVDHNAGIFVTMNPASKEYGGRSKLPDNLKQLFRPVAMSKPDMELITEAILLSEGFKFAKSHAKKVCSLYNLSKKLLSAQQHYDWGLRALKAVLTTGGKLILKSRAEEAVVDENMERTLLIKSIRVNTLSKLTFTDSQVFLGLIGDVFPGIESQDIVYARLEAAIHTVMRYPPFSLMPDDGQVRKMVQLKESLDQRMGCVIVGPSGCGKTTLWSVLKSALNLLAGGPKAEAALRQAHSKKGTSVKDAADDDEQELQSIPAPGANDPVVKRVETYVMNPKSMPRERLLGHMDMDTREWSDGVLTDAARQVVKKPMEIRSWIVCDGDVDPEWIESLNSVLDDNHLLTMPNGERISFGSNVNFIFETHDLRFASPATITRMGMIFLSDEDVDVRRNVEKWLREQPLEKQEFLRGMIDDLFYKSLDFVLGVRSYGGGDSGGEEKQSSSGGDTGGARFIVETTMIGVVETALSHLHAGTVAQKSREGFVRSLIRGLGSNLDYESRCELARFVSELSGDPLVDMAAPLDCYADKERGRLVAYAPQTSVELSADGSNGLGDGVVLQTVSVQRNVDMIQGWIDRMEPFILVGPEGAGKSMLLNYVFSKQRGTRVVTLHCNAQTTAEHLIQRIQQACVLQSTNSGRVYRPRDGDRLVLLLKDLNLPRPDMYNTCMLIAFLQQIITFNGFYDEALEFIGLDRVQIVGSMNPATTVGRHPLSTRFTAIVHIAYMDYPSTSELQSIYTAFLEAAVTPVSGGKSGANFLEVKDPKWRQMANLKRLAETMIKIYEEVKLQFSVDDHRHYLFTPRDLTAWVVGLLRYNTADEDLLDVFAYEAQRLFRDRLVSYEKEAKFDQILFSTLKKMWSHSRNKGGDGGSGLLYSSLVGTTTMAGAKNDTDVQLLRTEEGDYHEVVSQGLVRYEREERALNIVLFPEILDHVSRIDRVLSKPGGSILLVGRSGVGRRSATALVAHMHGMQFFSPSVTRDFSIKSLYVELKQAVAVAGVDNEHVVLFIEEFQMEQSDSVLETVNSLLSSGEVPGMYAHEELEALLAPLREEMAESDGAGKYRSAFEFFTARVQRNLHIVVSLDNTSDKFMMRCESNPALFTRCAIMWFGEWSRASMQTVPKLLLPDFFGETMAVDEDEISKLKAKARSKKNNSRDSGHEGKMGDAQDASGMEGKVADSGEGAGAEGKTGEGGDEEGDEETSEPVSLSATIPLEHRKALLNCAVFIHKSAQQALSGGSAGFGASSSDEDNSSAAAPVDGKVAPRDFIAFLHSYKNVYESKHGGLAQKVKHLRSGLHKLEEAKQTVDVLTSKADKQRAELKKKQNEADKAMDDITLNLEEAGQRGSEVQRLKEQVAIDEKASAAKKEEIEQSLADIKPVLEAAKESVGALDNDSISEIRSFKMPPQAVADVLQGVLLLLGIKDHTWLSMKKFLGSRGVKNDLITFDAHDITPRLRREVSNFVSKNKGSYDERTIVRACVAAKPMAAWVKANLQYSEVLETIQPLEEELERCILSLQTSASRLDEFEQELKVINDKVAALKDEFKQRTREAQALKVSLEKTEETLSKASGLLGKLSEEKERWDRQASMLEIEMQSLPLRSLLAAGFMNYLARSSEDVREGVVRQWTEFCRREGPRSAGAARGRGRGNVDDGASGSKLSSFELTRLMSTESEMLLWKADGLPADQLSRENGVVILNNDYRVPFVIDPSMTSLNWLQKTLARQKEERAGSGPRPGRSGGGRGGGRGGGSSGGAVEVISSADPRFANKVELAVRFGKTLIIKGVDGLEPLLVPLARRDLQSQGGRFVVQIGDKTIDYDERFRLYLVTRDPSPQIPPDIASLITEVNFTVTRSGLEGQLLGVTIKHEKPELEEKKSAMLREEEECMVKLAELEETLLQALAESEGNILENTVLIQSLTQTKISSAKIKDALTASFVASKELEQERNAFRPFARDGSRLYFLVHRLRAQNHMYQFSLAHYLHLFQTTLDKPMDAGLPTDERIRRLSPALEKLVLRNIGQSLFKEDLLLFGMFLAQGMHDELVAPIEMSLLMGRTTGGDRQREAGAPSWADENRAEAYAALVQACPDVVNQCRLEDKNTWKRWVEHPEPERNFPESIDRALEKKNQMFRKVLVVQALRPDRLQTAMELFACRALDVETLAPPQMSLQQLFESGTTSAAAPILMITTAGADPSKELSDLAYRVIGEDSDRYVEIAMGGGQEAGALQALKDMARAGGWVCLKNLHLVVAWLPTLEKELSLLKPHENFRLWLTTEPHTKFPSQLLQQSVKLTFESPPGVKKNLQRTLSSWDRGFLAKGSEQRAALLFVLAFFHAIVQERRNYVPQGWTKFYEFSVGDLRAGVDMIQAAIETANESGSPLDWATVHGLMMNAIYGGRIDNNYDYRVLEMYLRQFFNGQAIGTSENPGETALPLPVKLPRPSLDCADYVEFTNTLSDTDGPELFGLPPNIERAKQREMSAQTISKLKSMMSAAASEGGFDRERWRAALAPVLGLWSELIKRPGARGSDASRVDPKADSVELFVMKEVKLIGDVVAWIDGQLNALKRVVNGTGLLTPAIQKQAGALIASEVPSQWERKWEGPEDPQQWMKAVIKRKIALGDWARRCRDGYRGLLKSEINLAELLNPPTFLDVLRQLTARETGIPIDDLVLGAAWGEDATVEGASRDDLQARVGGLLLQGATFGGKYLRETPANGNELVSAPSVTIAWIPKGSSVGRKKKGSKDYRAPLYYTERREKILAELPVPVRESEEDVPRYTVAGVALFLADRGF